MTNTTYLTVRIVAAVVDTVRLTLYKPDGSTIFVEQGNPNLRRIVAEATPQLLEQGWADIHLEPVPENSYAHFEKESSGVVRFFKIAKAKLKDLMVAHEEKAADIRPLTEMSIGKVPTPMPAAASWNGDQSNKDVVIGTQAVAESLGLNEDQEKISGIPASMISAVADAVEQFGEDELERYRDEQEAKKEQQENCEAGIHSWTYSPVKLAPDTKCTFCGEAYGHPQDDLASVYAITLVLETREETAQELNAVEQTADDKRAADAVAEILAHAMPVTDPEFNEKGVGKQGAIADGLYTSIGVNDPDAPDTIIAVVGDQVIPGVERIKTQFARAAKMGSTIGVENFLSRLAAKIGDRKHTVDELLNFLERADLPIADDGSILIYKVLNHHNKAKNTFVDCYSGKVEQWVGCYVCMDEKLVDWNRRTECSVGLHVARRGYVRGFPGNVCVLGKLAPEDVIAVPHGQANKLRACGYHIIAELTEDQHNLLRKNRPITDDAAGKILLAKAIAGQHGSVTHHVEVTGAKGEGVVTTQVDYGEAKITRLPEDKETPVAPVEALPNEPEHAIKDKPVDPVGVAKMVTQTIEQQKSKKQQAKELYMDWVTAASEYDKAEALTNLLLFKKAAKKGWDALDIPDPTLPGVEEVVPSVPSAKPAAKQVVKAKPQPKVKTKKEKKVNQPQEVSTTPTVKPTIANTIVEEILQSKATPFNKINQLRGEGIDKPGVAQAILDVKKAAKKSWEYFGMNGDDYAKLLELAGKK